MKNKIKYLLFLPIICLSGCTSITDLWGKPSSELKLADIATTLAATVNLLTGAAGAVAFIFIIIGGYQYMASLGNEEQATKAKQTLLYAFLGLIIIFGAYMIIRYLMLLTLKDSYKGIF